MNKDWRKSSFSFANGNCIQVASGARVRDSKYPDGPVLAFTRDQWRVFTAAVKAAR